MAGSDKYVSYAPPGGIPDLDFISTDKYNAGSNTTKDDQDSRYAIFYDDGPGYLYVRDMARGTEGQTMLVHSVADGKLYVRKIGRLQDVEQDLSSPIRPTTGTPGQHQLEPREVSHYRPYPNIPGLIDFKTLVHNPPHTYNKNVKQYVTYWQFCNGGDLEHYIAQYSGLKERIPEIIIWRFLWQIFKTCQYLQHCQPPVSHTDIFNGNIFVHYQSDLDCRSEEQRSTNKKADFYYYNTFPDRGNGDMPDFYLGDFGHAISTYRSSEIRHKSLRHDIECISESFKKLVLCTAMPQTDSGSTDIEAELTEMTDSVIRKRSYSADLVKIWEELSSLKRHFSNTTDDISVPLDLKLLDDFIKTLGKLYPKDYSSPTVKFTRPASNAPPALFESKEQLLLRHGRMSGGPWYVCTINANHEIRIINEACGLPGQTPSPSASDITSSEDSSPPTRPDIPIPSATAYLPKRGASDLESSSSQYRAAPATKRPRLKIQAQRMNPEAATFTPRFDTSTPINARQEASVGLGPTQTPEPLAVTLDKEIQEAMGELGEGSWQYSGEDDEDGMYGPAT